MDALAQSRDRPAGVGVPLFDRVGRGCGSTGSAPGSSAATTANSCTPARSISASPPSRCPARTCGRGNRRARRCCSACRPGTGSPGGKACGWPRELADRLFAAAGLRPDYTCETDEPGATGDLISAGLGVGVVPGISRRVVAHTPGAWLRLDAPDCHRVLPLVWRADTYLSTAAQRLIDFASDHFHRG